MKCSILKHKSAKDNTKQFIAEVGGLKSFNSNEIADYKIFMDATKQLEQQSIRSYGVSGRPWLADDNGFTAVPNYRVLRQIDNVRKRMGLYEDKLSVGAKLSEVVKLKQEKTTVVSETLRIDTEKQQPSLTFPQFLKGKLEGSKMTTEIEGKLGADKERLIDLLGSSMYSEKLKDVVYKELLQNAFDAIKIAEAKGLIDKGKIDIVVDKKERTITFTDNGIGMTPEIVQKAFFTIGGTYKGDNVDNKLKSGGLGLAKMAFIFGSEELILETIHDGIKTSVNATSKEIRSDNFKIITNSTTEKNGTKVTVKIPESYINSKGETRSIDFPFFIKSELEFSFLKNPLIGNVDVTYSIINKGSYEEDEKINTELGKIPEGYILFSPATTSFADIDIYIDTQNIGKKSWDTKHEILSSGLHQFNMTFNKKVGDEKIPLNIIINIKPKVEATNTQYPFNNQRENFRPTVKNDVVALGKYLQLLWHSIEIQLLKQSFSKIQNIDVVNVESPDNKIIEKNKQISKKFEKQTNEEIVRQAINDFIKDNQKAEIKDGSLSTKSQQFTAEQISKENEKDYNRTFKAERKIDVNKDTNFNLDPEKPFIHNNTTLDFNDKAIKFISEISSIMLEYKQSIIDFYGEDYSPNLKTQLWGVSIDKTYGGVNVNPSFVNMLAINPFYQFPDNPKINAVNYIAVALDHLIIHELNHNFERNEGAGFTGRFLQTYSEIHSLPNHFQLISKLKLSIKNNLETIKILNYEYKQSENVESGFEGNKFEENNQRGTSDGAATVSENDSINNARTEENDTRSSDSIGELLESISKQDQATTVSEPQSVDTNKLNQIQLSAKPSDRIVGTRIAIDTTMQERLFGGKEVTSTADALSRIPKDHPLKPLANKLAKLSPVAPVKYVAVAPLGETALAYYDPNTNEIVMYGNVLYDKGDSTATFLHEVIHELTYKALRDPLNQDLINEFDRLRKEAQSKLGTRNSYFTESLDEFITGVFTKSTFIKDLMELESTQPTKFKNLWEEVWHHILSIFKIGKKSTLYDQAFAVATNILEIRNKNWEGIEEPVESLFARESTIPSPASTNIPEVSIAANIYELMPNLVSKSIDNIYYQLIDNKVDYQLRIVTALQSDKVRQPKINNLQGFFNDIQKQGIPSNQLDLLREIISQKQGEFTKEDLVVDLLAEYSYTIEINIAKERTDTVKPLQDFTLNNDNYTTHHKNVYREYYKNNVQITKEEYDKAFKEFRSNKPTQYYSNLTVPGGTNYTENEIATPSITPSIKGHAQFSTAQGIGWFRSDDKVTSPKDPISEMSDEELRDLAIQAQMSIEEVIAAARYRPNAATDSKTRRILEVQSDLFQKGRDSKVLSKKLEIKKVGDTFVSNGEKFTVTNIDTDSELYELITIQDSQGRTATMRRTQLEKRFDERGDNSSDNQFLQLLNKDNNWVTFFIKSIIQDSAKKEYKKVLFPTGNTASKVEGHTTLEEFKKQKEDRIKELEEGFDYFNYELSSNFYFEKDGKYYWEDMESSRYGEEPFKEITKEIYDKGKKGELQKEATRREIDQLKQELERVDREGLGALKPIYNFYETTVANVLKKQGYSPKQVTDEYGNTWNEVTLDADRDLSLINFQIKEEPDATKLPSEVKAKLLRFAEKLGIKIEILEDLLDRRGVNALADIKHMIIQIQNGKEDGALAEEVAHFFVEGLDENSPLYQEMMQIIPYTRIYQEVVRQYREVYGNDTTRLKKEAMGKLIALYTSNRELAEYWAGNPSVFSAIVEWIKRFFANLRRTTKYNAFIESAERILNGDVSELSFSNKKGVYYQIADGKFTTLNNQNLAGRKLQINLNDTIFDYKGFIGPLSPAERIRVGGSSKYYQTAKLTSFALELKDKIASGSIDPKNITIYTTMEVTSVLAERLLREFGITKVVQLNKVDVFPGIDGGMIQVEVPEFKEKTYRQNHKDEFFIDDKPLEGVKYTIYNKRVQYVPLEIRRKRERRNEAFQAQQEELNAAFKLIERTKLQKQAEKLFALIVNSPSSLVKKIKAIEKKLETMTDEELRSVFKDDLGNVNLPTTELRQAAKLLAETDKIDKGITQFISGIRILTEFFDNINTQVKKIKSDPDNISEVQVEALIYEMMRTTKAGDVFKRYAEDLLIQLDKVEKTEAAKELISKLRTSITLAQNNIKEVSMQVLTRKLGNSLDGYEYNTQAQIKEYEEILKTNSIEYTTFLFGAKKKRPLTATERRKIDVELNKLKERKSPAEQIMNVFLGKAPAFNSLTVWVKTLENSSDPAIAAIAKMINETNQRVYVKSVQQTQDFGQQVRDYMKANGITEEMIDKNLLITEIDLIYNPDNDSYEPKERLAFLNPFKNRHIFRQKLKEVQDLRDEYMKSMEQEVNGNADLKKRYLQARAAFEKWKVENWHDEYTEEYYKRYEGIRQKYGEELYEDAVSQVNEINDSITEVKESLRQGFISYQEAHKQIKELNREKAALKLPSYPDGSVKSEKDKQIALLLQEKSEIDLEVYEYKSNYKRFVNDFMKEVISQDLSAEHREFIDAALQSKDLKGLHLYLNKNGLTDLSDWLFYNTIRKNTKEFYDDRKAITDIIDQKYSELRKLQGKEPQQSTQELWDEMFKLTKPYRDEDGHIIGSDVPDFSQNLVNEINQKLEEIRREVIKSEEEDIDNTEVKRVKKEISELFTQLSTIQSKDLTEEYVLSFEDLLSKSNYREYCDAAEIAYPENDDAIKALRNSSDFLYYIEQNKDTELGQWFFRNHYLKQQKVRVYDDFGGYVEDTVYEQTPTYIWNQITPLKDSYTEIIPGFKYSDREVISKYQTEKIEGVTFSSVTNRWLPKSSEFRNEAYFTLARTNPKLFTLLQMMTKFHLDTQVEGLSEAKLEYFVPSVEKGKLEGNVVTNTINDFLDKNNRFEEGEGNYGDGTKKSEEKRTIYRRLMDWVDTLGEEEEEEAVRLNKYTDKVEETRKKIAVPFARYMEPDQVSRDVLSTLILFRESTNRATAMKDVLNTTLLVKTILEGEPSQKERLEAVKFLEDTRIFGVNKIYELGEDADKKLAMLRKVYAFGSQSDLTGFFTNVKNNLAGRIQNFLHSEFAGWSDNKSMRKAAKYWKNNLFYYLAESEKPLQERSKDWYIQTYLNPSDMRDILMYSQPGAAKRFGSQYMLFWTKSAMEYSISVNSLYSHLFHKEVRKGTERKTLYDIIVIKDGRMTIEDGWTDSTGRPIDEEYLIRMKTMLKSILEYIQGKVGSQIKLNTTTIGAAVTFFKGWLIPNIRKRYDKKRANYVLDRDVEGYWRTFYRLSIQMIKNFKNYGELNWATFTEEERAAYRTTAKEMLIMAMTTLLITVIFGFDIDDEDKYKKLKEKSFLEQVALLVAIQTKLETESLSAFPLFTTESTKDTFYLGISPILSEAPKFLTNPVFGMSMLNDATDMFKYSFKLLANTEDAYYDRDYPMYNVEEGEAKAIHNLKKILQFDDLLYTWTNPEGRLQMYINMIKR